MSRFIVVAAVAAALATGAIVASSSSGTPATTTPTTKATGLLDGIPERDGVLGAADAPVTLTEFVDPQCPVCAAASKQLLPTLIEKYVRTGKVKLDARVLHFIGPDSLTAARWAEAARRQDRLWAFLETLYANQGQENSGYVTPAYLRRIAALAGVDAARAQRDAGTTTPALARADAEAKRLGVTGTPSFAIDGRLVPVDRLGAVLGR